MRKYFSNNNGANYKIDAMPGKLTNARYKINFTKQMAFYIKIAMQEQWCLN